MRCYFGRVISASSHRAALFHKSSKSIFSFGINKKSAAFATDCEFGAGNEARTRDPDLGKVVLYQLSYSRKFTSVNGATLYEYFNALQGQNL